MMPLGRVQFSPALRTELALALREYVDMPVPSSDTRLHTAADRVCTEAHALELTAEQMTVALKLLYAELPGMEFKYVAADRHHIAFERFLAKCIKAYVEADERRSPDS